MSSDVLGCYLVCSRCATELWGAIRKRAPEPLVKNLLCEPCYSVLSGFVKGLIKVDFVSRRECSVPGCGSAQVARGTCNLHYARASDWARRYGCDRSLFLARPELLVLKWKEAAEKIGVKIVMDPKAPS